MSNMLRLSVGNAITKPKDGVYEYDIEELPIGEDGQPATIYVDDDDFDDFVDFITVDFPEFWKYIYIDYACDQRRKFINNISYDINYCVAIEKDDVEYFKSIYEFYRNETLNLPSDKNVLIHPALRVKFNSLYLLAWLNLSLSRALEHCIRPALLSHLYTEEI